MKQPIKTVEVLGMKISDLSMEEVLSAIDELIRESKPSLIFTADAQHARLFQTDPEFAEAYNAATLVTADGFPVIWASKLLGQPIKNKICGSDLTEKLCSLSAERRYRIYFLGAAKDVAEKAKKRCEKLYPGVKIVGLYSPTRAEILDDEKSKGIIAKINLSGANVLFVALGSPIAEIWMHKYRSILKATVSIGVGGSLDYLAGILKRSPLWVRQINMEWFARLIQNPKHYFARYIKDFSIVYYIWLYRVKSLEKTNRKYGKSAWQR